MRWLVMILLACALFAGCYWLDRQFRNPESPATVAGNEAEQDAAPRIFAAGFLTGEREEIDLKFELPGRLRRVLVATGSRVQAGQVLAELEPGAWEAQLAEAQARLSLARAQRELLLSGRRDGSAAWRPATSPGGAAIAEGPPAVGAEELKVADAQIQLAATAVNYQQLMLAHTRLLAPGEGEMIHVDASPGDLVGPADMQERFVIAPQGETIVRAYVEELDALDVQVGQRAAVSVLARRDRRYQGVVSSCAPELQPKRVRHFQPGERLDVRVREVTITFDDSQHLSRGTPVEVLITPNRTSNGSDAPR